VDSLRTRDSVMLGGRRWQLHRLDRLGVDHLPFTLKVLLENLLRHEDGQVVTAEQVEAVRLWDPTADRRDEVDLHPTRVFLHDTNGVPTLVDLAAMRDALAGLGGDPQAVNPVIPAELVADHSVIADVFGRPDARDRNVELEYARNSERYRFLKWGQTALDRFKIVPPGMGIMHQVNIEYLARVVEVDGDRVYPDVCLGTDSHTTMVNGLGVLGWGIGGIEAEAVMLGQSLSLVVPPVVGFRLTGALPPGATATDLVLTITELLRGHGVVGKFVEFHGPGVSRTSVADRVTIANMSPEFGSTCAVFPIDAQTLRYLRFTGRSPEHVALVEAYAKQQGLWHEPDLPLTYSERIELDLSSVVASLAGPRRPQDRVPLTSAQAAFRAELRGPAERAARPASWVDEASQESFPASDAPAIEPDLGVDPPVERDDEPGSARAVEPGPAVEVVLEGRRHRLGHGAVAIAAITSCTNTSNPQVMVAAGLLARNAARRGLARRPWVKTTLSPGSLVVMDYLRAAGLVEPLEALGFHLAGFGCMTCIGASGPLIEEVAAAVRDHDLTVVSVLSGNRNFEGRIHPEVKLNYLASPPLVVAYALAGTMDLDLSNHPLGHDQQGQAVFLSDLWPSPQRSSSSSSAASTRTCSTAPTPGSSTATTAGRPSTPRPAAPSPGIRHPPTCAARPTWTACRPSRPRSPTSSEPASCSSWATPSPPTTSPRPGRSPTTATPAATWPAWACRHASSTPSPPAAATTRSWCAAPSPTCASATSSPSGPSVVSPAASTPAARCCRSTRRPGPTRSTTRRWWSSPARTTAPGPPVTGRPRAPSCSASAPSWPSPSNASTAPTSSAWASCPSSSSQASRPSRWA
jgi:aconitate hydratase